jgi:hypothetical protein
MKIDIPEPGRPKRKKEGEIRTDLQDRRKTKKHECPDGKVQA